MKTTLAVSPSVSVALPLWKRFSLVNYRAVKSRSEETVCYRSKIALDGEVVGDSSNEGRGGSDFISIVPAARAQWNEAVAEWAKSEGEDSEFEVDALFIEFLANQLSEEKEAAKLFKRDPRANAVSVVKTSPFKMGEKIEYASYEMRVFSNLSDEAILEFLSKTYPAQSPRRIIRRVEGN